MKLKTLKDLEVEYNREIKPWDLISKTRVVIRKEAIKHIKDKIKRIEEHSHAKFEIGNFEKDNCYMDSLQCRNDYVQIQWIKYFFNITDEELK